MSFNRLDYDTGCYKQYIAESVGPLEYQIGTPKNACEPCMPKDPGYILQRSGASGAVEELMSLNDGTSAAVTPVGLSSSMLITVGIPAENVMLCSLIQSKKLLWEKRRAKCRVHPVSSHGIRDKPCAEFQPKDLNSRVLSSSVSPNWSIVDKPKDQWAK